MLAGLLALLASLAFPCLSSRGERGSEGGRDRVLAMVPEAGKADATSAEGEALRTLANRFRKELRNAGRIK